MLFASIFIVCYVPGYKLWDDRDKKDKIKVIDTTTIVQGRIS